MTGVNLIPIEARLHKTCQRRAKAWILSVLAATAALCVPLTMNWAQRSKAASLTIANERILADLALIRSELRSLTTQALEAELRAQRAKALRSKREWSAMLTLIERALPERCWLTSIATDPPSPGGATRATVRKVSRSDSAPAGTVLIDAPRALLVSGYATDPSEPHAFVTAMKRTGVFEEVSLEDLRQEPIYGGMYFRFELRGTW